MNTSKLAMHQSNGSQPGAIAPTKVQNKRQYPYKNYWVILMIGPATLTIMKQICELRISMD